MPQTFAQFVEALPDRTVEEAAVRSVLEDVTENTGPSIDDQDDPYVDGDRYELALIDLDKLAAEIARVRNLLITWYAST